MQGFFNGLRYELERSTHERPTSKVDISLFTDFAGNNNRAMFVFMPERELVGT